MFVLFRRFPKTAMFIGLLKVATTTSNFMNEVSNEKFMQEFSVSMLGEIITPAWAYVYETKK